MYQNPFHKEDLSNYNFLITGGAGFIGSNIVEYLLKYNAKKVRVLDNLSNGYYENIEKYVGLPNFEFIEGDIRDVETCKKALEGIDYVSHQAALGSVPRSIKDPITSNAVNISGFLNMLTAVKDNGNIKRMVYAASSSTYGDSKALPKVEGNEGNPLSPYAVTKLVNEVYADVYSKVYNLHTVGLRYFNVFGPNQSPDNPYAAVIPIFVKAAQEKRTPIINGDGETSRDFTFVENAVQANVKAMLNTPEITQHEVVNIAFGERATLNELWKYICDRAGIEIKPNYGPERAGDVKHSLADISKAGNLFGYKPEWSLQKGITTLI
ncbi:SDR family oxidoreductase [uncultured Kordia sp.]|uniref:SDR family oxidoreductase n=1 Tax=uncultured Kordia sp. TaxID=507699 RepID=UPI0026109A1D|nr:SDR family oxidoreductase [uncultured Kordia sp.]